MNAVECLINIKSCFDLNNATANTKSFAQLSLCDWCAPYSEIKIKPYFDKIRYHVDELEIIVDDAIWPLPKYWELLFTR